MRVQLLGVGQQKKTQDLYIFTYKPPNSKFQIDLFIFKNKFLKGNFTLFSMKMLRLKYEMDIFSIDDSETVSYFDSSSCEYFFYFELCGVWEL